MISPIIIPDRTEFQSLLFFSFVYFNSSLLTFFLRIFSKLVKATLKSPSKFIVTVHHALFYYQHCRHFLFL